MKDLRLFMFVFWFPRCQKNNQFTLSCAFLAGRFFISRTGSVLKKDSLIQKNKHFLYESVYKCILRCYSISEIEILVDCYY